MIDLTGLSFVEVQPSLLEFGGIQRGSLGGPSQNLQRLGNRFSFALALPPLEALTGWTARIVQAKQEGAVIRIPEPGWVGTIGGAPIVANAVTGGTSVRIGNLLPGTVIPAKWISIIHGGVRYSHLTTAPVTAGDDFAAVVTITPMLRTPLASGDLVEIDVPKAQGLLVDKLSWGVGKSRLIAFTLSLEEQK